MRSTFRDVLKQIWHRTTVHPTAELLLESLDGQLDPSAQAKVRAHVADCVRCKERLNELREGIHLFNRAVAPLGSEFSADEGLKRLFSAIRHGEITPARPLTEAMNEGTSLEVEVYDRLLFELSIYLGRPAAKQLLLGSTQPMLERDRLVAVVEPVITGFFGQHTGAAVVANVLRIWDHAQHVAS